MMTILGGLAAAAGGLTPAQVSIANAGSAGPNSFAGLEWLVALNLGSATALVLVGLFFASQFVAGLWRNRYKDRYNHPVTAFRGMMLAFILGGVLRSTGRAAVLWKWNPADPVGTSAMLTAQRFLDPVADGFIYFGFFLAAIATPTLIAQLRRSGWEVPIWQSLPMLRRPAILTALSFMAAAGVVWTR